MLANTADTNMIHRGGYDLAGGVVDIGKQLLIAHHGNMPGLLIDSAGGLQAGGQQRVQLSLGDGGILIGAVAAARSDGIQYGVGHDKNLLALWGRSC